MLVWGDAEKIWGLVNLGKRWCQYGVKQRESDVRRILEEDDDTERIWRQKNLEEIDVSMGWRRMNLMSEESWKQMVSVWADAGWSWCQESWKRWCQKSCNCAKNLCCSKKQCLDQYLMEIVLQPANRSFVALPLQWNNVQANLMGWQNVAALWWLSNGDSCHVVQIAVSSSILV